MARHKSVYDDIDRSSREYIVRKRDGTKRYTPLPEVTLSFEEPVENVYFSDRAMKTNEFSPTFSKFYDAQMANLTTKFVSSSSSSFCSFFTLYLLSFPSPPFFFLSHFSPPSRGGVDLG